MTVAGARGTSVEDTTSNPTPRDLGMTNLPRRWKESIIPKRECEATDSEVIAAQELAIRGLGALSVSPIERYKILTARELADVALKTSVTTRQPKILLCLTDGCCLFPDGQILVLR